QGIDRLRSPETSLVLVTHYQRVLGYVIPDFVHVLVDGRIVASAGKELAQEVEANGYDRFEEIAGVVRTSAGRKS
ncbi:MAG: Fe-S cluster assembly ATPase SufC, partial [Chloroflexi bacterium]|nr:Fe-S cluster assembly ATPase SufC [Chloroflexota bacterium]